MLCFFGDDVCDGKSAALGTEQDKASEGKAERWTVPKVPARKMKLQKGLDLRTGSVHLSKYHFIKSYQDNGGVPKGSEEEEPGSSEISTDDVKENLEVSLSTDHWV